VVLHVSRDTGDRSGRPPALARKLSRLDRAGNTSDLWTLAGRFTLCGIERDILTRPTTGWELYLELTREHRRPDFILWCAVFLMFLIYYIGATALSFRALLARFGEQAAYIAGGGYVGLLIVMTWIMIVHFPRGTTRENERVTRGDIEVPRP